MSSQYHPKYIFSWIGLGLLKLLAHIPLKSLEFPGKSLGRFLSIIAPWRASVAKCNLEICFPELNADEQEALFKKNMEATGFAYMEMAKAWWASDQELKKLINIDGLRHLDKALKNNKGVILLTAHFTSLEIGARLMSIAHPISVTFREFKNPVFDQAMISARSKNFNNAIHRNDIRGLIKALKENDVVWYAADQDSGYKHSVFAPFFGKPAATLNTTGRLVKMSGAAILFFTVFRNSDGTYNLSISEELENYPGDDIVEDATRTNLMIENAIRTEPSQYLWIHRRYKSAPRGEHKPYAGKPRRLKEREQIRKQQSKK